MKPTEMYFEPVLIGFATLFIAGMLASYDLERSLLNAKAGELAAIIAAAYFVGLVVDRLSDAILEPLNHHHRLLFALEKMKDEPSADEIGDPFPEDEYHIATMNDDQASEYVYYLRSRIRLLRAMVVLTPAGGVAVALRSLSLPARLHGTAIAVVCAVYAFAVAIRCNRPPRATAQKLIEDKTQPLSPPRTGALRDPSVRTWYAERIGPTKPMWRFIVMNEPLSFAAAFLAVFAGVVARRAFWIGTGPIIAAANLFAVATLTWCWWRVSETFFTFLRNYSRFSNRAKSVAAPGS